MGWHHAERVSSGECWVDFRPSYTARRYLSNNFSYEAMLGCRGADHDGHVVLSAALVSFIDKCATSRLW